ncbi:MAG: hypothetical protein HYV28_13205, partial [Ignavibacteriales bacterium]|nr:hypothetical protein [Ignavibacteriales bacterium]
FCKDLEQAGFLSAPYLELRGHKPEEGFIEMVNLPRFSTGYSAVQNRLCVLVETHSLKPFKNRVYSTKKMNESILELCHTDFETIKLLNEKADKKTLSDYHHGGKPFPLRFVHTELEENLQFKGYKSEESNSAITGSAVVRYTKVPVEFSVPYFRTCEISETVKLPEYYIIPPEFSEIIRVLKLHGIKTQVIAKAIELPVQQYVFSKITFARAPYEGRFRVSYSLTEISMQKLITEGFVLVPLKQRGLKVIAHLLEPNSEDSFAAWGFFNAFFERKEYAEEYVFEPIAQKMYADDETLREKFNQALQDDEKFVNDPGSRLDFFYRNSGYFDEREKKYPIFRCFTKGKLH